MELPNDFIVSLNNYYGNEAESIINTITSTATPISIRYNRIKTVGIPMEEAVLWHPSAIYLEEKPIFTLDPHFHGGKYYVQEASSMFIYEILRQLKINKNARVLDLCAAPGGKSTLLADYFNEGLLVSNEIIKNRAQILKENIVKWGSGNVVVCNSEPHDFLKLESFFNVVLVDAPCSGEGMFRKDHESISEWSLKNVEICYLRQQEIIKQIIPVIEDNGYLIYCTCTYNHKENIDNVWKFCNEYDLISIPLELKDEWKLMPLIKEEVVGYQFLPDRLKGEGFFVSVLQKNTQVKNVKYQTKKPHLQKLTALETEIVAKFIASNDVYFYKTTQGDVYAYREILKDNIFELLDKLKVIHSGIKCGNLNKNVFIPDHSLAMSLMVNEEIPRIALNKADALAYLNKSLLSVHDDRKGWCLVTFEGTQLGWIKNLGNRINNYYPVDWRIRMNISIDE